MSPSEDSNPDQREVIAFLSDPASYGPDADKVTRCETHGSIVFLAGDRAYKLKRAVKFPYMDYSTIHRREQMCLRELEINRRTAPTLYLCVLPMVWDRSNKLRFGTTGERARVADWVVVMQRFEQELLLEEMRKAGKLTCPLMRSIAETIADFHARAEPTRGFGGAHAIGEVIDENAAILRSRVGRPFGVETVRSYCEHAAASLEKIASLLDIRRNQGRVRRCHGDLHLNNICLIGERPVLFDAIEFNDAFSCIDLLYDLAFLLMDLIHHGLHEHANTVLNRYLELTEEHSGLAVLPLFLSCRAAIRAHTSVAAAEAVEDGLISEANRQRASALLDQALFHLAPASPRLVAIGGPSGTGKSTVARALAPFLGPAPGAVVIRSDVVRKQLMGVEETVRLPETAYIASVTKAVYELICERAATALAAGFTVIADAVYGDENEREALCRVAEGAHVPFRGIWLAAPRQVLESRIQSRRDDASDATVAVLRAQLEFISVPEDWTSVRAAGAAEKTATEVRRALGG
jgi:aminoglycoside phosphotransferase family enzyme/predicted kinase